STSRTGTCRTGRCPEPPGCAVYGCASGDRSRSTFESTLAKGPSANEMGEDVIDMVTNVKSMSLKKRQHNARRPNRSKPLATCLNLWIFAVGYQSGQFIGRDSKLPSLRA